MGGECVGMGEEVRGLRHTNRQLQNSHGDIKNSVGNGAAKELTHMTHEHEQICRDCLRDEGCCVEGVKGENQANCNSIINEI